MRPNFEKAQNMATRLLLEQNLDSLFIDVRKFMFSNNITIDSMQNFCNLTGYPISDLKVNNIDGACTLIRGKHRILLYDDSVSNDARKHWGIIHELGHVYLGHTCDDSKSEIEAHFFAAQIVTPEIVLWDIYKRQGQLTNLDVFSWFNVSYESAGKRIKTMNRRHRYNVGDIDKQLLNKFSPILDRELFQYTKIS